MEKTKGFKPMPLSIKIIFVLYLIGFVISVISIPFSISTGISFLGFAITGAAGIALMTFVTVLQLMFIISLWNRYTWAWKYGLAYMAYSIINTLLGMFSLPEKIAESTSQLANAEVVSSIMTATTYASVFVGVIISGIIAYFIYRNRAYFEG